MLGIVIEKDIFKEIGKSKTLTVSFVGENCPPEYRDLYAKFTQITCLTYFRKYDAERKQAHHH